MHRISIVLIAALTAVGFSQQSGSKRVADAAKPKSSIARELPFPAGQAKDSKGEKSKQQVLGVIRALAEAGMKRDVATIERFHSDDFFHTNADGSMMTKSEVLESYKATSTVRIESDEVDEEKAQLLGNVAVVSCRVTLKGRTADGRPFTTPFRVTYVLRKRGDNWKLTASHASVMR
ncbi:MAG: nuclear transport factor 2 family protein [Pyrinomonadaceae bacterium]